ncbi:hypothetical protein MRX96_037360 [Rhipicephalus microplus]
MTRSRAPHPQGGVLRSNRLDKWRPRRTTCTAHTWPGLDIACAALEHGGVVRRLLRYIYSLVSSSRLCIQWRSPHVKKGRRGYTSVAEQRQTACHPVANVKCPSTLPCIPYKPNVGIGRLSAQCRGRAPRCLLSTSEEEVGEKKEPQCVAATETGVSGMNTLVVVVCEVLWPFRCMRRYSVVRAEYDGATLPQEGERAPTVTSDTCDTMFTVV